MPKRRPDGFTAEPMGDEGFYPSDKGWNPQLFDDTAVPIGGNQPTTSFPESEIPLGGQQVPATNEPRQPYVPLGGMDRFAKMPEYDGNTFGQGSGRNAPLVAPPPSSDAELQQSVFEHRGTPQPETDKNLVAPPPGFSDLTSPGIERPEMIDSRKYDEKGNLRLEHETDPNKIVERGLNGELVGKSKWWKRALRGALDGFATGGIGGAMAGAAIEGFYPKSYQKLRTNEKVAEAKQAIDYRNKQANEAANLDHKRAQIENAQLKPHYEDQKIRLREKKLENDFLKDQRSYDRLVKQEEGRNQRAGNQTKTQEVDGYLFRVYPNDPTREMEPIIDPRTGKQAYNPANVAQEVTFDDGTKAFAKGGQIVSGKFAAERQASQQEFQGEQNDKNRAQALTIARDRIKIAREALTLSQQRFEESQGQAKVDAENEVKKNKLALTKLKAYIKNNPLVGKDGTLLQELEDIDDDE